MTHTLPEVFQFYHKYDTTPILYTASHAGHGAGYLITWTSDDGVSHKDYDKLSVAEAAIAEGLWLIETPLEASADALASVPLPEASEGLLGAIKAFTDDTGCCVFIVEGRYEIYGLMEDCICVDTDKELELVMKAVRVIMNAPLESISKESIA